MSESTLWPSQGLWIWSLDPFPFFSIRNDDIWNPSLHSFKIMLLTVCRGPSCSDAGAPRGRSWTSCWVGPRCTRPRSCAPQRRSGRARRSVACQMSTYVWILYLFIIFVKKILEIHSRNLCTVVGMVCSSSNRWYYFLVSCRPSQNNIHFPLSSRNNTHWEILHRGISRIPLTVLCTSSILVTRVSYPKL